MMKWNDGRETQPEKLQRLMSAHFHRAGADQVQPGQGAESSVSQKDPTSSNQLETWLHDPPMGFGPKTGSGFTDHVG